MKIKWGYYEDAFPYTCDKCHKTCYEMRDFCEWCGSKNTLRKTTKTDYKKAMKERNK